LTAHSFNHIIKQEYFGVKDRGMTKEDITQIRIGNATIGIVGLKEAMEELSPALSTASNEETAKALIQKLSKKNYIPEKAKAEYGRALVREFQRFLGREVSAEDKPQGLVIRVLGQGCANCHALTQRVMEVLGELKLAADVEHITDIKEIASYGAALSPALVVNGKIVAMGRMPSKDQLIEWFKKAEG